MIGDSPDPIPLARPCCGDAEIEAAAAVIRSGWLASGPQVAAFEAELAPWAGGERRVVCTSSGTAALQLALLLVGVGPGDEVLLPSYSFIATAAAVCHVGARPVFCDTAPGSDNLDPDDVERRIGPAARAIVGVDQFGNPADWDRLEALAGRRGLTLIGDCACSLGSTLGGRPCAARGTLAIWSFHPRKLVTSGEGGALVVPPALEQAARELASHGQSGGAVRRIGFNFRLSDLGAAVARPQLGRLHEQLERRRALARRYAAEGHYPGPLALPGAEPNYQSYPVRVPAARREELLARLHAAGIEARRGIPPIHRQAPFACFAAGELPHTNEAWEQTILLPLYEGLDPAGQGRVIAALV